VKNVSPDLRGTARVLYKIYVIKNGFHSYIGKWWLDLGGAARDALIHFSSCAFAYGT
jgi:hypothetical protein